MREETEKLVRVIAEEITVDSDVGTASDDQVITNFDELAAAAKTFFEKPDVESFEKIASNELLNIYNFIALLNNLEISTTASASESLKPILTLIAFFKLLDENTNGVDENKTKISFTETSGIYGFRGFARTAEYYINYFANEANDEIRIKRIRSALTYYLLQVELQSIAKMTNQSVINNSAAKSKPVKLNRTAFYAAIESAKAEFEKIDNSATNTNVNNSVNLEIYEALLLKSEEIVFEHLSKALTLVMRTDLKDVALSTFEFGLKKFKDKPDYTNRLIELAIVEALKCHDNDYIFSFIKKIAALICKEFNSTSNENDAVFKHDIELEIFHYSIVAALKHKKPELVIKLLDELMYSGFVLSDRRIVKLVNAIHAYRKTVPIELQRYQTNYKYKSIVQFISSEYKLLYNKLDKAIITPFKNLSLKRKIQEAGVIAVAVAVLIIVGAFVASFIPAVSLAYIATAFVVAAGLIALPYIAKLVTNRLFQFIAKNNVDRGLNSADTKTAYPLHFDKKNMRNKTSVIKLAVVPPAKVTEIAEPKISRFKEFNGIGVLINALKNKAKEFEPKRLGLFSYSPVANEFIKNLVVIQSDIRPNSKKIEAIEKAVNSFKAKFNQPKYACKVNETDGIVADLKLALAETTPLLLSQASYSRINNKE